MQSTFNYQGGEHYEHRAHTGAPRSGPKFLASPYVEALAQSGLSRREYCRQHNLSYHAATYWLRKLPQAVVEGEPSFSTNVINQSQPTVFILKKKGGYPLLDSLP